MANRFFRKYIQHIMTGGALDLTSANMKWALIDTAVVDPDTTITGDEFYSDISSAVIAGPTALSSPTVTDGVLDAGDATVVDGGGGDSGEEIVIYYDTGTPGTSRLVLLIDTASGLPITLDGINDSIQWNASGIAAL